MYLRFLRLKESIVFYFQKIDRIDITINYFKGETKMFHANLTLSPKPIERFSFFP